jgi:hypothetical protein
LEIVASDTVGAVAGMVGQSELGSVIGLELLLLPLRHGGATNRRVLGALSPAAIPSWLGLTPLESLDLRSMRVIGEAGPGRLGLGEVGPSAASKRHRLVVLDGGLNR